MTFGSGVIALYRAGWCKSGVSWLLLRGQPAPWLGRARSKDEGPKLDTAAVAEMGAAYRQLQGLGAVAGPQHEKAQRFLGSLGRHRLLQNVHLAGELAIARQLPPRGELSRPGDVLVPFGRRSCERRRAWTRRRGPTARSPARRTGISIDAPPW